MRLVVTGATGFLGRHLTAALLRQEHTVSALVRNPAAALAALGARVTCITGDLSRPVAWPAGDRADALIHLAALSSNWGRAIDFHAANVDGTAHALALARQLGVRRVIHISSPSIYFRFADQLAVAEGSALPPPVNAYAQSKQRAEALVQAAGDLNPLILRPRGIYGTGDTALLPRLVRAAKKGPLPLLRDGAAVTDLTHVDDVVNAIIASLSAPVTATGPINISGGEPLAIRQIIARACAQKSVPVRWRSMPVGLALAGARFAETVSALLPGQPEPVVTAYSLGVLAYSQTLDLTRAHRLLNWHPAISFDEGLARLQ